MFSRRRNQGCVTVWILTAVDVAEWKRTLWNEVVKDGWVEAHEALTKQIVFFNWVNFFLCYFRRIATDGFHRTLQKKKTRTLCFCSVIKQNDDTGLNFPPSTFWSCCFLIRPLPSAVQFTLSHWSKQAHPCVSRQPPRLDRQGGNKGGLRLLLTQFNQRTSKEAAPPFIFYWFIYIIILFFLVTSLCSWVLMDGVIVTSPICVLGDVTVCQPTDCFHGSGS